MPATFWWTGQYGTAAADPHNWQSDAGPAALPGVGDVLHFSGVRPSTPADTRPYSPPPPPWLPVTSVDCDGLVVTGRSAPEDRFAAVYIEGGYSGTVFFGEAIATLVFAMSTGAIAQDGREDLTVVESFEWTGGTLNTIDSGASVYISGATGTIDPPDDTAQSISTASTLRMVGGAVVDFLPGVVNLIGGSGMKISGNSQVWFKADPSVELKFSGAGGGEKCTCLAPQPAAGAVEQGPIW